MKENEVSYRILYIDGERIISEESVIGSNSILEQLESIIAKIELSKPTGQLQSICRYLQPIVTQYLVCNKSEIWP